MGTASFKNNVGADVASYGTRTKAGSTLLTETTEAVFETRPNLRTAHAVSAATAKQRMLKLLVCSDAPECRLPAIAASGRSPESTRMGRGALFGPVVAAAVILAGTPWSRFPALA